MSAVRRNLLSQPGYSPYCGNWVARHEPGGCSNPRTRFTGKQFRCPECGWESGFEPEFIEKVKEVRRPKKQ